MHDINNEIAVYAAPLPFSNAQIKRLAKYGDTVKDIVDEMFPAHLSGAAYAIVLIRGDVIPVEQWATRKPKLGEIVNVRIMPGKGGKKSPLASILSIAVMIAAPYVGAALGSVAGFGGLWVGSTFFSSAAIYSAAFGVVGRLAINALAPPPKSSKAGGAAGVSNPAESPTQFIEGAKNSIVPFGRVPICLGTNRMFPLQCALPYTETIGNDQYVRQLFTFGYGDKIVISQDKIGETLISEFQDFEIEYRLDGDLHEGTSLYTNDVFPDDYSLLISNAAGYQIRTTRADIDEAIVDITFPRGLTAFDAENGTRNRHTVQLEIQYAPTGTEDWSPGVSSYKSFSGSTLIPNAAIISQETGASQGYRRDIVVVDIYSGVISIVQGSSVTYEASGAVAPTVPANKIRLSTLLIFTKRERNTSMPSGYKTTTSMVSFTDDRQVSLFGSTFENSSSFVPSRGTTSGGEGGSLLDTIVISSGAIKVNVLELVNAQTEALRKNVRIVFPQRGTYDIRVRRITPDYNSDRIFDDAYLSGIKNIKYQAPVTMVGINGAALRMRGTEQLNGAVDQYNVIASLVIPDWNPTIGQWLPAITSNPASLYRYVLQSLANARRLPDNKLILADFEAWHEHCTQQGYTYNRVIDYETTVDDVLRDIAAAGSASPAIVDGKRTIVVDRLNDEIVQVITPRNSWNYSAELIYPELAHAFRVQFRNKDKGYNQDERVVYDDGYDELNATVYETLEYQSCDNPILAFKHGRRHIATSRLQPESHSWMMDVENLIALRGNRVLLEHDVPIIGLGEGRIKQLIGNAGAESIINGTDNVINGTDDVVLGIAGYANVMNGADIILNGADQVVVESEVVDGDITEVTGLLLDDVVTMPNLIGNYYARIRKADNTLIYKKIITEVGEQNTIHFEEPVSGADIPERGDLVYVVEAGGELDLIITKIEPMDDLTAKITAVNYAPDRFTAESTPIPPWRSFISTPLEFIRPEPPRLLQEQSDESVMLRNSDGSFTPRAIFTLENTNIGDIFVQVKLRISGTESFTNANILEASPERVILTGLDDNIFYDLHIRYGRVGTNVLSKPLELNRYKFIGAGGDPTDVQDFTITVSGENALFKWRKNDDIDIKGYRMKYSSGFTGATWQSAQLFGSLDERDVIIDNRLTTTFLPGTYLIKAVDISGNESANATQIVTYDPGQLGNAVAVLDQHPTFSGTKDNVFYDSLTDTIVLADIEIGVGYYYFDASLNLDGLYESLVTQNIIANGVFLNNFFDIADLFAEDDVFGGGTNNLFNETDIFAMDDVFGIGANKWAVTLQYRTASSVSADSVVNGGDDVVNGGDDVVIGGTIWSEWKNFTPGYIEFYEIEFRLKMESFSIEQGISPSVSILSVKVDMPDRIERGEDITIPATGYSHTFDPPFRDIPSIVVTLQDGDAGDTLEWVSKDAGGFELKVYNQVISDYVERSIDFIASGFGKNRG